MSTANPSRRRLIAGAAAAPAALAGVALLPKPAPIAAKGQAPASGYRLTEHVQRYYDTTRG